MAEISLVAIGENEVGDRQVFNTGVSTVGKGGNDYFCGHCGRKMMHNMNLATIMAEMAYQCDACKGYNIKPE